LHGIKRKVVQGGAEHLLIIMLTVVCFGPPVVSSFKTINYNFFPRRSVGTHMALSWTYNVQADMNASTAFRYDTGGRAAWDLACWVDRV